MVPSLPACRSSCLTLCPWQVGQPVVRPPWQHLNSPRRCLMARTQWRSVTPTAHYCRGFQLITAAMLRCYLSMKEVQDTFYPNKNSSDLVQWVPNNVKTVSYLWQYISGNKYVHHLQQQLHHHLRAAHSHVPVQQPHELVEGTSKMEFFKAESSMTAL